MHVNGNDGDLRDFCDPENPAMERQHLGTGGRPFGKVRHLAPCMQEPQSLPQNQGAMHDGIALHELYAETLRAESNERPRGDLALGNRKAVGGGGQDERIDPALVVAHDDGRSVGKRPVDVQANVMDVAEPMGAPAQEILPLERIGLLHHAPIRLASQCRMGEHSAKRDQLATSVVLLASAGMSPRR